MRGIASRGCEQKPLWTAVVDILYSHWRKV